MADAEQCPLWLSAHNRRVNPTRLTSLGRVVVARGLRAIVMRPELLRETRASGDRTAETKDMEPTICRLKLTLRGSRPPIWRRIEVHSDITLCQLHDVIQLAMGWTNSHLHQFRRGSTCYGPANPDLDIQEQNERRVRLSGVLRKPKDRMVYEYDFGDGWEHEVVLERSTTGLPDAPQVRVIGGKGACPPEDVGGLGGDYGFLEAIKDPAHPEHDDMLEWCGGGFDPDAFDFAGVNKHFRARTRRRKDA